MSNLLALVVEDDYDAAFIFSRALEENGYTTQVIRNGRDAIERLGLVEPRLVLLDLHLPEVAGSDILHHIRSEARLRETKVILVTADARMAEALEDQSDLVLIKPVTFSQVRDLTSRFRPG